MNKDQLSARLLATFVSELTDQVHVLNTHLLALESSPADPEHMRAVFRVFHTLKGAARAANVPRIEQLCHEMETMLAAGREGGLQLTPEQFAQLFAAADALADGAETLRAASATAPPAARTGASQSVQPRPSLSGVDVEKLDALLGATGELIVANQRMDALRAEMRQLHEFATTWARAWSRSGGAIRVALENANVPPRARSTLQQLDDNLRRLNADTRRLKSVGEAQAGVLGRITGSITEQARQLRMRKFSDITEALPRAVRDLATSVGKQIDLRISGESVQADRAVLTAMSEAVLQLVRNAVDHGIESASIRLAAGKPERGLLRIAAEQHGDHLQVRVQDDGAGLDFVALQKEVERRGRTAPTDPLELLRTLTELNVSTRAQADAISGRGVGLDIVYSALARVQGRLNVQSQPGRGTTFVLECPTTLATMRAVLLSVDQQAFALPATRVARIARVQANDIRSAEGRDVILSNGAPVPVVSLARVLGPPLVENSVGGALVAAILRSGERQLAVLSDAAIGEQEIVVRPLNSQRIPAHIGGAAQLPTGRLALLLNVDAIVEAGLTQHAQARLQLAQPEATDRQRRRILVVDDSITTRTLEQSVLQAAGYDVMTAVDGADAWRMIQEHGCDLVVSDVEMPRLDGFALCQTIRSAKRFQQLPVILVSALESPEHRTRGLEVGADAYLGKSSFDQKRLLELVRQLVGEATE